MSRGKNVPVKVISPDGKETTLENIAQARFILGVGINQLKRTGIYNNQTDTFEINGYKIIRLD